CRLRRVVSAGGAEFRTVLAAPHLLALSRHPGGRVSRAAAAGPGAPRIHRGSFERDRNRHGSDGRGRKKGTGAAVRPRAISAAAGVVFYSCQLLTRGNA